MGRQRVRLIFLQIVDDENGAVRLIPVFSKFGPSDLGAIIAEDRGMGGTVFPRGDFFTIITLEIDDIDLKIQSVTQDKAWTSWTYVLLGVPCGWQLRVQRGIHDVSLGNVKIVLSSERFNGRALEGGHIP